MEVSRAGRSKAAGPVGAVLLCAALAACGQGGDKGDPVARAQAVVDAAKQDLADAEAMLADKSSEFCGSSESYILALDRYGDVLARPR